jgi:hypothetical protein
MMKERILLILSLILVATALVFAQTSARKTVTNADLEKFRQKRLQAEADYRANYKKLGMPSPEELDEREAERRRRNAEFTEEAEMERAQNENYLLARAGELKTQIISVEAQIRYLRGQSANQQSPYKGGTIVYGGGLVFGGVGGYGGGFPRGVSGNRFRRNNMTIAPNAQTVRNYARSFPTAGDIRNQIFGTYPQLNNAPRRRYGSNSYYGGGYVASSDYSQSDFESRLSYLEQQYAGLLAEWQNLEEAARRAGVRIE